MHLRADDPMSSKQVKQCTDQQLLHAGLYFIHNLCEKWNFCLNLMKCFHLYSSICHHDPVHTYYIGGHPTAIASISEDLCISVTSSVCWSDHAKEICKKAYSVFHTIEQIIPLRSLTDF